MINLQSLIKPFTTWVEENRLKAQKIVFIIFVLLCNVILASRIAMGHQWPVIIIVLVLGIILLITMLKWPIFGLILTMVGGFFIPFTGPGGLNATIFGIAGTLGVWCLGMLVIERKIQLIPSRTISPLLVFILISLMAFGIGQLPWYQFVNHAPLDAQLGGLAIFVLSAATFILVPHLIRNLRSLEWLTWIFIILGGIYVIGRSTRGQILNVDLWYQQGAIAQSVFWVWLSAISFSQAFLNRRLHLIWRIFLGCLVMLIFYVAFIQNYDWKSGWFPSLISIVAIIAVGFWNLRQIRLLTPILIIAAVIGFYFISTNAIGTEQYSWGTRLDAWYIVIEIAKASPIIGLGFANYYWYTPLIPIRGYSIQFNSHSQLVDIFAQTGVLGLACFFWFFWEVGRLAWWLRDRLPDGFYRAYVYGALGGLAGTLVASALVDWVLPFVYNIGLTGFRSSILAWIFLGGLVAIEQKVRLQIES
jgi:hypothetical protein